MTQQNAAAAEEMSATSVELAAQAEQLQSTIAYFRIGHDGAATKAPTKPAAKAAQIAHLPPAKTKPAAKKARAGSGTIIEMDAEDSDFQRY